MILKPAVTNLSILYLHTAPKPKIEGTDAIYNDTALLRSRFEGTELSLFPFSSPSSILPRSFYGWHHFLRIIELQKVVSINHVFSPGLFHYPVFNFLSKPTVYSVTASVQKRDVEGNLQKLKNISKIILSNPRDFRLLQSSGLDNITLVRPGIDTSSFKKQYLPLNEELVLMMASAPWEPDQFKTKGIDLLLQAAKELPFLKLILLWRGSYASELQQRINTLNVGGQIEIVNRKAEVNAILSRVHGTILLAENANLVKAFPHSLIESLAAGKPVITSSVIAMSDYIAENKCGFVVDAFSLDALIAKILQFRTQYVSCSKIASRVGAADFTTERMLEEMSKVYEIIRNNPH